MLPCCTINALRYAHAQSIATVDILADVNLRNLSIWLGWTQWSVETTSTIHVLPVPRLFVDADSIRALVASDWSLLGGFEFRESHHPQHLPSKFISINFYRGPIHLHMVSCIFGEFGL